MLLVKEMNYPKVQFEYAVKQLCKVEVLVQPGQTSIISKKFMLYHHLLIIVL
jgi:hypothetical protein